MTSLTRLFLDIRIWGLSHPVSLLVPLPSRCLPLVGWRGLQSLTLIKLHQYLYAYFVRMYLASSQIMVFNMVGRLYNLFLDRNGLLRAQKIQLQYVHDNTSGESISRSENHGGACTSYISICQSQCTTTIRTPAHKFLKNAIQMTTEVSQIHIGAHDVKLFENTMKTSGLSL